MAAEMAVEITAQETALTEDRQAKVEHSEATVQEGRLARAEIVQEDLSEKILRGEALEATVREDHSERILKGEASAATVQEDHLAKVLKEEASVRIVQEEVSAKIVQEEHSETTLKKEVSEAIVQGDHSVKILREEVSAIEDLQETEVSTQQKRASTRRISIISAMRMRAESTR